MAILKSVSSSSGIEVINAYIKVDEYSCAKGNVVNARVRAYVSRNFEIEGKGPIEGNEEIIQITASYEDGSANTKKQIYEHMKTLPQYQDAVDVLE